MREYSQADILTDFFRDHNLEFGRNGHRHHTNTPSIKFNRILIKSTKNHKLIYQSLMMNQATTMRLGKSIKQKHPHLSLSVIRDFLQTGLVRVNGKIAQLHDTVRPDDQIEIDSTCLRDTLLPNPELPCRLIQMDDDYIFFDKGPGVPAVAQNYLETQTAANWLLSVDGNLSQVGSALESGLLHRLDNETGGLMVAARCKESFSHLKKIWGTGQVIKEYASVVTGPPPKPGLYKAFAWNRAKSSPRVKIDPKQNDFSREIVTEIIAVKKINLQKEIPAAAEIVADLHHLQIRIFTGFRHQIRAHLAFLGCPILGEKIYHGENADRLYLKSIRLSFEGRIGQKYDITLPPPF